MERDILLTNTVEKSNQIDQTIMAQQYLRLGTHAILWMGFLWLLLQGGGTTNGLMVWGKRRRAVMDVTEAVRAKESAKRRAAAQQEGNNPHFEKMITVTDDKDKGIKLTEHAEHHHNGARPWLLIRGAKGRLTQSIQRWCNRLKHAMIAPALEKSHEVEVVDLEAGLVSENEVINKHETGVLTTYENICRAVTRFLEATENAMSSIFRCISTFSRAAESTYQASKACIAEWKNFVAGIISFIGAIALTLSYVAKELETMKAPEGE